MDFVGLSRLLTKSINCSFFGYFVFACMVTGQSIQQDVRSHPNWKFLDTGDNCGLSFSYRIVGGEKAYLGQYPWIARVGYSGKRLGNSSDVYFICGGALISDRYVITAAHCSPFFNFPDWLKIKMSHVRLGEFNVKTNPDCMNGVCAPPVQDIDIEEYFCHPGYTDQARHDDICIVRLARPVRFDRFVFPICLPVFDWFLNKTLQNLTMEVAGWGIKNVENQTVSDVLLTVAVPIVGHSQCKLQFKSSYILTDKQLCAGGVVGRDSCQGDSGGPLMASLPVESAPRYFLMGIVSYGDSKCGSTTNPGIYTRTTEYLTWILDHVRA